MPEQEVVEKRIRIENEMGLHARPAALLVQAVGPLDCEISLEKDGEKVNGKSIMGVMMLAAECGSEILVTTRGPDAKKAIEEITRIVQSKFSE